LPVWLALRLQVPKASKLKALPFTVHTLGVLDANVTSRPDEALANKVMGWRVKARLPGDTKLMLCAPKATLNDWLASAAAKLTLPACAAPSLQVPALSRLTLLPLTVHTSVL
jgi:hypothetical protein